VLCACFDPTCPLGLPHRSAVGVNHDGFAIGVLLDCLGVDVAAGVHHVGLGACKLDFVGLAVVIAVARGCSHAGAVTLDAGRCPLLGLLGGCVADTAW
jgi:hypothetical protein